ncbi:phosphoribosyltransferase [Nonomuraea sp. NPDC000554]|uniref:phosphoribosyltransferase n=1 Tax=Nonomuraea sp. NPDC000554 TaxID=3154259 RepID=UPI003325774C
MGDARAVTDHVIQLYRNVPATRSGVCRICHTGPNNRYDTGEPYCICSSCERTMGGLYRPTTHVVPISLAVQDGDDNGLFKIVVSKANARAAPSWMTPHTLMAATLSRFYEAHEACLTGLAGGPFTLVTSIPTTRRNQPVEAFHPLIRVINDVSALKDLHKPQLLLANDEYVPRLYDRYSHPDAFHVMGAQKEDQVLRGERVLLVDDWFISGAHVQSAASKLFEHGAEEVVALVIIRVIDPSPSRPNRMAIWQEASAEPFDFDRCCIRDRQDHAKHVSNL